MFKESRMAALIVSAADAADERPPCSRSSLSEALATKANPTDQARRIANDQAEIRHVVRYDGTRAYEGVTAKCHPT